VVLLPVYDLNIHNVSDLVAFLQGMLLLTRSITTDFDLPQWFVADQSRVIRERTGLRGAIRQAMPLGV
jgi:hypothetical protein